MEGFLAEGWDEAKRGSGVTVTGAGAVASRRKAGIQPHRPCRWTPAFAGERIGDEWLSPWLILAFADERRFNVSALWERRCFAF